MKTDRLIRRAARAAGIALILLLASFSLDVFSEARPLSEQLTALLVHAHPAIAPAAVLAAARNHDAVEGAAFSLFGAAVLFALPGRPPILAVPAFAAGGLFFLCACRQRKREKTGGERS